MAGSIEDEWLWGWDPTPGIVSVWAEPDGRAFVWRRLPTGLVREDVRFRPWMLLASLDDLTHLGARLRPEGPGMPPVGAVTWQELDGPGALRFVVRASDGRALTTAVLQGATRRLGRLVGHVRDLGQRAVHAPAPEEQYLIATGRTYFRDLAFDDLRRMQLDLETTGLEPQRDRIFLIALRGPDGQTEVLEAADEGPAAEAELLGRLMARVRAWDPDVIENHNLHGFDLPFLAQRAALLRVPLTLGRAGGPGLRARPSARGAALNRGGRWGQGSGGGREGRDDGERGRDEGIASSAAREGWGRRGTSGRSGHPDAGSGRGDGSRDGRNEGAGAGDGEPPPREDDRMRRSRYTVPGRELIDTMDAVLRHDFSARDLPGHGLKAVARHFGLAREEREHIPGARVHAVFKTDPERVRRYARDDVTEAAGLARLLGGAAFALARMAPRRYERLADAGAATGVLDPLLVRAYLHVGAALPAHEESDGTSHSGAALHLFASGVARRIVKADVASLYPSLMRQYRISPRRDRLGALLALVDRLLDHRLAAKAKAKTLPAGSPERFTQEAISAAMKLVINSAYGYLAAGGLTRFADVHAANEVTRHGREVLGLLCRELAARGVTLLEADTDGVYFAVPEAWSEADERRIVGEVAALLPPQVHLEFDGRYAAMLSHEPKNYALQPYQGPLILRGVAFRSSRSEPFGEVFLREAITQLLAGDIAGVRQTYVDTVTALRRRELPTQQVAAQVRLSKPAAEYLETRAKRRELPYEAVLANGQKAWTPGERIRVYRANGGRAGLLPSRDRESQEGAGEDPRDYDVEYYARQLRETFAARLATGLTPEDFAAVFADPQQGSLFAPSLTDSRPILTVLDDPTHEPAP